MALSPPAVFSMSTGNRASMRSKTLRQLSKPTWASSFFSTCPPCTIRPLAPIFAAASSCWAGILRLGMRMRLFDVATLTMYGACT